VLSQVNKTQAVGSDVSPAALAVAGRNAERHQVSGRLTLVEADGLDLPDGSLPDGGFHLIVSNPPYVAEGELTCLPENVRRHEPRAALSAGPDGLVFYRLLHDAGPGVLRGPGASVFVEIGAGLADAVAQVMEAGEVFEHAGTWADPGGSHDRVMQFVLRAS
jgi:release factor glutamine methyltransferase